MRASETANLRASWDRAWRDIGAASEGSALLASLLAAYAQPHRHYHSLQHLGECLLQGFEPVQHLAQRPAELALALWFHDAVYELHSHDSEARSADWAARELRVAGVPDDAIQRVVALVLATRHALVPMDGDQQLLVDIDLSILGAPPARFAQYEQQIRAEYAFVPDDIFRSKRRAVLQTFLDRPRVYSTAHFQSLLEQRARENLRAAVA